MWFTPLPHSAGRARREARDALRGWGCRREDAEAVVLVVSELATNAIRHARARGRLFEVRLHYLGDVSDPSTAHPRETYPDDDAESGRGLLLVAANAEKWGWRPCPTGKTVWARVRLPIC
ncbi:regulatory protein [Streptantibioticus cattleyicolor NRRL 8057 = DSM 46488]|uniref:Regulatory protein n=2 Tax=Kitasatosporales TaxID=85011 RepID=G8WZ64_STREN|nr:regulatory protein [Streptantibioticus cattleyicolor NRRL 8057 = DSM 46488]MYS58497.1 ATP-binding protein [Streptomyces sp. SID5468]